MLIILSLQIYFFWFFTFFGMLAPFAPPPIERLDRGFRSWKKEILVFVSDSILTWDDFLIYNWESASAAEKRSAQLFPHTKKPIFPSLLFYFHLLKRHPLWRNQNITTESTKFEKWWLFIDGKWKRWLYLRHIIKMVSPIKYTTFREVTVLRITVIRIGASTRAVVPLPRVFFLKIIFSFSRSYFGCFRRKKRNLACDIFLLWMWFLHTYVIYTQILIRSG